MGKIIDLFRFLYLELAVRIFYTVKKKGGRTTITMRPFWYKKFNWAMQRQKDRGKKSEVVFHQVRIYEGGLKKQRVKKRKKGAKMWRIFIGAKKDGKFKGKKYIIPADFGEIHNHVIRMVMDGYRNHELIVMAEFETFFDIYEHVCGYVRTPPLMVVDHFCFEGIYIQRMAERKRPLLTQRLPRASVHPPPTLYDGGLITIPKGGFKI